MEKENNVQNDVKEESPKEITFGNTKYLHTSDEEWDYLVGINEDGIKMILKFTKDKEKHKKAMEAVQTFFSYL